MSSEPPDDHATGSPPPIGLQGANSSDNRQPDSSSQLHGLASTARTTSELGLSTYWHPSYSSSSHDRISFDSHIDPTALQAALPPDIPPPLTQSPHFAPDSYHPFDGGSQYIEESANPYYTDSDRVPLTAGVQPISGSHPGDDHSLHERDSFQTVRDLDNNPIRDHEGKSLGHSSNLGYSSSGHQSYGLTLDPGDYRLPRSASTSGAFLRAGSIVRAMSQRVVNLSGESDVADQRSSRYRSRSRDSLSERRANPTASVYIDEPYYSQPTSSRAEKAAQNLFLTTEIPSRLPSPARSKPHNPLKGTTLGIFSPESRFRLWMCDLLVNPYTEPFILILILSQTILLAVESWPDVFSPGNERPDRWGKKPIDWTMLGLFIVFTVEIVARIVVSGFILNAEEYSTIDRKRGIRAAIADRYKTIFQPQRQKSMKRIRSAQPQAPAFARSFTTLMQGQHTGPKTVEEQQRFQLARRAFLRHSFNRLDFVAVFSFWITFVLGVTGSENRHHFYLFKMLSCLRILRLLALTHGTAIILRSLKKAAPLLVRVAFLISFFWLLFAIIGIQSFKSSLSRQCVWLDPLDPNNLTASFTNSMQFCGGYLDNVTGATLPWVKFSAAGSLENLVKGTAEGKGYLCPRGSICLQQDNPYNGTVNFDNILHSLELVFVIMSANTFSDLMYYTMGSDYPQAALFFGAAIMIMMLWLTNLLIAVITSSFQVIREESKSSAFTVEPEPSAQPHTDERKRKASPAQRLYKKTSIFWLLVVAFALLSEACRSASMSHSRGRFIDAAEIVATILLDIEILIRIVAYWRRFHRSWRNIFDLGLAIITSVILIPPVHNSRVYAWLTVFQVFRAYRLVLAIPVTRTLILLVLGSAAGIGNLMLFVFLMTFLVAILAAQLFRGQIPVYDDGELNRISFNTVFNSFLGMYQILSSENWTNILYSVTSYTTALKTAWIGAVFLIGWFILSFFILINMFIAVIQENFDVSEDEKRLEQVKAFLQRKELGHTSNNLTLSTIFSFGKSRRRKDPLDYGPGMMEMLLKDTVVQEFLDDEIADPLRLNPEHRSPPQRSTTNLMGDGKPGFLKKIWDRVHKSEPNPFYSNLRFDGPNGTLDPRQMARQAVSATSARRKAQRDYLAQYPRYNTSLYIFPPSSRIRRLCQKLVGPARGLERFDGVEPNKIAWYSISTFIYASVFAMVVIACVTTPLYQKEYRDKNPSTVTQWYIWTDLAFAVIFTIEAVIKIIADGLVWTPNAFLRSSWGIIDAVVLITLWINVVTLLIDDGAISRALGAFKALRALRLLNVSDRARDTFHSLIIVGWWKLLGAAFVSISLLIPFAIYGLNLFNGVLVACNDSGDISILSQCFGEFNSTPYSSDWPMLAPRVASNPYFGFDDFGSSLFTLFQIVSQEGWVDVSFAAQAITGPGMQPQDLANQGNAMFFVVFNLLATVFILTLFISVFMRNYTEQTGVAFLTAEQRSWLELRKLLRHISPSKSSYDDSENKWKKWCHKRAIEKRGKWYQAVTVVLVLHLLLLVAEFNSEPAWWTTTREYIFLLFILIYISNITIRIVGLGWTRFRRSSWDLYSLVSVSGAFIATLALLIADTRADTYVQLHKIFLVAIVLLVIPRNDALDQLFKTAAASLPVISNLLATWFVFFLVFAIAMTQTFSLTRFGDNEGSDINFRTVPMALIFLFRMSLGEGWNQIMEDYAGIQPPLCVEAESFFDSDCGSKPWARFLFIAWNIVSMYIFVNLFVSLIYESFSYVYQRSSGMAVVDRDEIRRFKEAWRSVDPAGTGYITKEAFPRLLGELSGVFQMRIYEAEDSVRQILEDVREDIKASRHTSIISTAALNDIDINKLNERLNDLDIKKIRKRRHRFNIFYEEVLVSADPDKGIAFTDVLMILAHYNIINDSKSLRLEEFLRRRARLQRVDEGIRRRIVQGFFDTLYWSRKFKEHMERKRASRMTTIPQLRIPDILVEDDEHTLSREADMKMHHLDIGAGVDEQRKPMWPDGATSNNATQSHPLGFPRSSLTANEEPRGSSTFSFELETPDVRETTAAELERPADSGNLDSVQDMLDGSVWIDSIRRSATLRATDRSSYRYDDLT
ncbi:cation channel family [Trichoderma arundinaceum]|uniref:Calcium-channel protein CCH1 n=1 Tax=Trichoderma arundinaceum TaxID=490622 RepID=A0A395N7R6_TRIAR|nr:cation channel family [Trichoderma arundinaceum]